VSQSISRRVAAAGVGAGAAASLALQQQDRWSDFCSEPSDLSEPSGLAPSVSIKQTTAPTAHHSLS
jgi:hypothetical protein